jgi:hypothetical protein
LARVTKLTAPILREPPLFVAGKPHIGCFQGGDDHKWGIYGALELTGRLDV